MSELCLVAARRTPVGRFLGKLKDRSCADLGEVVAKAVLNVVPAEKIDQVLIGNVLGAGQGMNIARQIGVRAGIPVDRPAVTINMMCGSGLESIRQASQLIKTGEAETVLCGGVESMSQAAYLLPRARQGLKLGDATLVDSILSDGLRDAFDGRHMGEQAEDLAAKYDLSRDEQDAWALRSQQFYAAAAEAGIFADELVPAFDLTADEHPRPDSKPADLAKLKPSFRAGGTVTAGNASGINDGAALVVLTRRDVAQREGWPVLCLWDDAVTVGCEPAAMGLGPVHALRLLSERQKLDFEQLDQIEINEAFAAQTLACLRELGCDSDRVNPEGGAIALGHPIGASGARLVVHLAWRIASGDVTRAAAALCVGGGMGTACLLSRDDR